MESWGCSGAFIGGQGSAREGWPMVSIELVAFMPWKEGAVKERI
jgi:hypothetical protein